MKDRPRVTLVIVESVLLIAGILIGAYLAPQAEASTVLGIGAGVFIGVTFLILIATE